MLMLPLIACIFFWSSSLISPRVAFVQFPVDRSSGVNKDVNRLTANFWAVVETLSECITTDCDTPSINTFVDDDTSPNHTPI